MEIIKHLLLFVAASLVFGCHKGENSEFDCSSKDVTLTGIPHQWHKVSLRIAGPFASETDTLNPFTDYKLTAVFTKGDKTYTVPGFFAADGNAAQTSATSGNIWQVNFCPDEVGVWHFIIHFRSGVNIAVSDSITIGEPIKELNGISGNFVVKSSDKSGKDLRAMGRLDYVGEHYPRFAGSGSFFLKGGVDSPENLLAYNDFDGTYDSPYKDDDVDGYLHSYEPHVKDWNDGDPSWNNGKGKGIIGALNYLASEQLNSIYFLAQNYKGDGDDVWPWLYHDDQTRFDCSKLAQWEIVFAHAQKLGILLHCVHQENETLKYKVFPRSLNNNRKLFYRELIARFGHHNALVWNLGEESEHLDAKTIAKYIKQTDPYKHPIVLHTTPKKEVKEMAYTKLLSYEFFDGISFQHGYRSDFNNNRPEGRERDRGDEVIYWRKKSADAGRKWLINNDEQELYQHGVLPDSVDADHYQHRAEYLWGTYMGGGCGVEWYFGSETFAFEHGQQKTTSNRDRTLENFKTRQNLYRQTWYARNFFEKYLPYWEMEPRDELVNHGEAWCFAKEGEVYVVYVLKNTKAINIDLPKGAEYSVKWFNPREGGELLSRKIERVIGSDDIFIGTPPDNNDWVVLLNAIVNN